MTEQPQKLQVIPAEFLRQGYVLATRQGGEVYLYQLSPGSEPNVHAQTVFNAVEDLMLKPDTVRIYLSREDCAIATEFFPAAFE
jgi:hypothetical protein